MLPEKNVNLKSTFKPSPVRRSESSLTVHASFLLYSATGWASLKNGCVLLSLRPPHFHSPSHAHRPPKFRFMWQKIACKFFPLRSLQDSWVQVVKSAFINLGLGHGGHLFRFRLSLVLDTTYRDRLKSMHQVARMLQASWRRSDKLQQ